MIPSGFYLLIAIPSIIFVAITYFLGRFCRHLAIIKYIPSIVALLIGIGFYIKARFYATGFEDLAFIILALVAGIVFVLSLITAIIMDIIQKKKSHNN